MSIYSSSLENSLKTFPNKSFRTIVDTSFLFAKLTSIADDSPYTYIQSCKVIGIVDEILTQIKYLQHDLSTYSDHSCKKIYGRVISQVIIESFLNGCILEMYSDEIPNTILKSFVKVTKALFNSASGNNCEEDDCNLIVEILEKLYIISAQHPNAGEIISLEQPLNPIPKYDYVILSTLSMYCPNVYVLEFLCEKYLAANSPYRDRKLGYAKSYLTQWHGLVSHPEQVKKRSLTKEGEVSQLEDIKRKFLEVPLTKGSCLLVQLINRIIICLGDFETANLTKVPVNEPETVPNPVSLNSGTIIVTPLLNKDLIPFDEPYWMKIIGENNCTSRLYAHKQPRTLINGTDNAKASKFEKALKPTDSFSKLNITEMNTKPKPVTSTTSPSMLINDNTNAVGLFRIFSMNFLKNKFKFKWWG